VGAWAVARPQKTGRDGENFLFLFPGGTASCAFRLAAPRDGIRSILLVGKIPVRDDRSPTTALANLTLLWLDFLTHKTTCAGEMLEKTTCQKICQKRPLRVAACQARRHVERAA
jgi:hypothetical protein